MGTTKNYEYEKCYKEKPFHNGTDEWWIEITCDEKEKKKKYGKVFNSTNS